MTEKANIYEEKAHNTFKSLLNISLEEELFTAYYRDIIKKTPGAEPRKVETEDVLRLKFEIMCFALSHCIVSGGIKYFSNNMDNFPKYTKSLLAYFVAYIKRLNISDIREFVPSALEPTSTFEYSGKLDPMKRIKEYVEAGSPDRVAEIFVKKVGYAIDPDHQASTSILAAIHAPHIIEEVEVILASVLGE